MKNTLKQRQAQLMAHLLRGDNDIKAHIASQGNVSTDTRLHIYRNAYQARLRETLDTDHPITGLYLGDELFELMVVRYRELHPSRHQSLRCYGNALSEFLATEAPFSESPQIAELARFERLLLSAFDAREARRTKLEELQNLPLEAWPGMTPTFHPSVTLFESNWNVVSMWQALKSETAPPSALREPQTWLVWRNGDLLTEFRHLEAVQLCLFMQFRSGSGFATACEALLEMLPSDEVSAAAAAALVNWLETGLIIALVPESLQS